MHLQIESMQPAIEEEKEKVNEFINVRFVASMTPKEFEEMKKQTNVWGLEVEIKKK